MNIHVLKFGGSSFRTLEDYHSVARILLSRLCTPVDRLVVVVSAMHGHTDRLLAAARRLTAQLAGDASDSLLTTGELVSASLLEIALQSRGVKATMLNGYRLGILSDSGFTNAKIRSIDDRPLRQALEGHQVVVVTGAQAVDECGRITMLGRNSSDLTAVALAAALEMPECEIYSDVAGVYTADPYLVPNARLLREISHGQLIEMARSGAKVMHFGAAVCAQHSQIRVICRATAEPDRIGTTISASGAQGSAVVLHEKACFLSFTTPDQRELVEARLSTRGIPLVPVDLQNQFLLVVTLGVLPINDLLEKMPFPIQHLAGKALITVIRNTGSPERTVANQSHARVISRKCHDDMYGESESMDEVSAALLRPNPALDVSDGLVP
jgi:aspartate kinase